MEKPSEIIRIPRPFCGTKIGAMRFSGRVACALSTALVLCAGAAAQTTAKRTSAKPAASSHTNLAQQRLEKLARELKQHDSSAAYAQLSAMATQKSSGIPGIRAALALGYYDYCKGRYPEAAKWLARAKSDPLLGDYALYWSAETDLALDRSADALAELEHLRGAFPDSVMTEQALASLGTAAVAAKRPADAVTALDAYGLTSQRPALLFLRGEAHEQAGQIAEAAADYQAVYTRYPASDQGREAGVKLDFLHGTPSSQIAPLPMEARLAHADALFAAHIWPDARNEYAAILPQLSGADNERAQLRILECGLSLGGDASQVSALKISDPDVEAERSDALAEFYRGRQQEAQMVASVEVAAMRAPTSPWTEAALFTAGNYYWVQLDRDRASSFYKRVDEYFPKSDDALQAQWRVAWTEVLKRQPEAADMLQEHLKRFPGSPYSADALYWLGRLAEEAGVAPLARTYYEKLIDRYSQNYFASLGAVRLRALGPGPTQDPQVIALIPPAPEAPSIDGKIPASAAERQARANALESIGFDSSAELELRAAYAATGEPRLMLEAAQEALAANRFGGAIVAVRQIYPQLESRTFADVPRQVWLTAYALPFEPSIRRWSGREGIDPMLVAGLIHQESAFDPDARSVSDAFGLMQLLPKTARLLARQQRVRYSRARLVDPDYNVRLGTAYFADLRKQFGSVEAALAAYNAGEDRVTSWTAGQNYRETAEFVESIPFTQTRLYVQIVTRNANIYRQLYGDQHPHEPRTQTGRGH
jgi:soluble lytic murein transglycosylase